MSPSPDSGSNPEMLELFRAELDSHLPVLSDGLLAMEKGPVEDARVEAMMRAAHSIKGAARIVGIEPAVRVAHVLEDCFSAAKKHAIALTARDVDILLEAVDSLQQICLLPEKKGSGASGGLPIDSLLERMNAIRDGRIVQATAVPSGGVTAAEVLTPVSPSAQVQLQLPALVNEDAARALVEEWTTRLHAGATRVQIDFSRVTQINAAGMAFLAAFVREAELSVQSSTVVFLRVPSTYECLWRVTGMQDKLAAS